LREVSDSLEHLLLTYVDPTTAQCRRRAADLL